MDASRSAPLNHEVDVLPPVVHRDGELVRPVAIAIAQQQVAALARRGLLLWADSRSSKRSTPARSRRAALGPAARRACECGTARGSARSRCLCGNSRTRRRGGVAQLLERTLVCSRLIALPQQRLAPLVGGEAEPVEILEERGFVLGPAADPIVILDAQEHLSAERLVPRPTRRWRSRRARGAGTLWERGQARDDLPAEAGRHSGQVGTRHAGTCGFRLQPEVSNMLIEPTASGLYCAAGDFYIDPWAAVDRAVITHAHGDHLRSGSGRTCQRRRHGRSSCTALGPTRRFAPSHTARRDINGVRVSLHPAGHILGSAQVRGRVPGRGLGGIGRLQACTRSDVCAVRAAALPHVHHRSHLRAAGLPVGSPGADRRTRSAVVGRDARAPRRPAVLFGYALGKAQRVLAELARCTDRPVYVHGALTELLDAYRAAGVTLVETKRATEESRASRSRAS